MPSNGIYLLIKTVLQLESYDIDRVRRFVCQLKLFLFPVDCLPSIMIKYLKSYAGTPNAFRWTTLVVQRIDVY